MTRMVEMVARAIYLGRNGNTGKPWRHLPKAHQGPYLADARAAIEAMREPSKSMEYAALPFVTRMHQGRDAYRAMIGAALNEEGQG